MIFRKFYAISFSLPVQFASFDSLSVLQRQTASGQYFHAALLLIEGAIPSCAILQDLLANRCAPFPDSDIQTGAALLVFESRSFFVAVDHSLFEVQSNHSIELIFPKLVKTIFCLLITLLFLPVFSIAHISVLLNMNYQRPVHLWLSRFDAAELCALLVLRHCFSFSAILVRHVRFRYSKNTKFNFY